jgi:hypothetical protein
VKILVACEESQKVAIAMRDRGHEAYSCDLQECSGGHPEWHIQEDVIPLLKKRWDMIIAFPPCTHLASSGAMYWGEKQADGRQQKAINFFLSFVTAPCEKIAIENPSGIISTVYRKPDQIIQPYHFGDPYMKRTCLWLKGLPHLRPTNVVKPLAHWCSSSYRGGLRKDGSRKICDMPSLHRDSKKRSKTFSGVAEAMADQWTRHGTLLDFI